MKPRRILLAASLAALLVAGAPVAPSSARAAPASAVAVDVFSVRVNGLACPFCAYGLQKKLKALPGARDVKVDLEAGRASFEAPAGLLSEERIRQAIKETGFTPVAVDIKHKA